jgi:hypothetical protein
MSRMSGIRATLGRIRSHGTLLRFVAMLTAAILAPSPAAAQDDPENELWPEVNAYVRFNPDQRLWFLLTGVREPKAPPESIQLGAHYELGLFPRFREAAQARYDADRLRFLRLRLGVRYLAPLHGDDAPTE